MKNVKDEMKKLAPEVTRRGLCIAEFPATFLSTSDLTGEWEQEEGYDSSLHVKNTVDAYDSYRESTFTGEKTRVLLVGNDRNLAEKRAMIIAKMLEKREEDREEAARSAAAMRQMMQEYQATQDQDAPRPEEFLPDEYDPDDCFDEYDCYDEGDEYLDEDDDMSFSEEGRNGAQGEPDPEVLSLLEVSLSSVSKKEKPESTINLGGLVNGYTSEIGVTRVLFMGLDLAGIEEQTYAVYTCGVEQVFLQVPPELLSHPAIQELICRHGFWVDRLEDRGREDFRRILQRMLEAADVTMESRELEDHLLGLLVRKFPNSLSEEIICNVVSRLAFMLNRNVKGQSPVAERKVLFSHVQELLGGRKEWNDPRLELEKMVGMDALKNELQKDLARGAEQRLNPRMQNQYSHKIFVGRPGTGKTTGARLYAEILGMEGVSNGVFYSADRSSLIGSYVGHTAPMVSAAFEKARNGVLFVDEAGIFLNRNSGGYIDEALKEFVRYMELYPDVTVIFAMYPGEAEQFLKLDDGLSSRISGTIRFRDYSGEELWKIYLNMMDKLGYRVDPAARELVEDYVKGLRSGKEKAFGNAREMRKLADDTVTQISLRHYEQGKGKKAGRKVRADLCTVEDVQKAVAGLRRDGLSRTEKPYGFRIAQESTPESAAGRKKAI